MAAALAVLGDAYYDPSVPPGVPSSYLALLHDSGGPLGTDPAGVVTALGQAACGELDRHVPLVDVVSSEERQHLTAFEADAVVGAAAENLCPSESTNALAQLEAGLGSH
jgi:hypothetical protein